MTIPREPDRLVLFTDAVVAIALTLLVLPLVEVVPEGVGRPAYDVVAEHWPQVFSFVLSFVVIAQLWLNHHHLFRHVRAYTRGLMRWNLGWLFAIVVLPFPTAMTSVYRGDRFTAGFYIATILAASLCQTAMILILHRTPDAVVAEDPVPVRIVRAAFLATSLLVVAFVLAVTIPGLGYYALLVLPLTGPLNRLWSRLRR
ncbi:TMEM175 family protein [Sphaerisporangium rubeum]|uniref:Putative membrane protein n=1 Tax=Sphaerisporangium rubeum TaxID=321317 RepID=A0A7X0IDC3_9ACTN|nr:TMEM175 family protein [Sphaerisporangium rubeum]MBB6473167.1 putative membrane protein [Sphaerisporangium rubeum]